MEDNSVVERNRIEFDNREVVLSVDDIPAVLEEHAELPPPPPEEEIIAIVTKKEPKGSFGNMVAYNVLPEMLEHPPGTRPAPPHLERVTGSPNSQGYHTLTASGPLGDSPLLAAIVTTRKFVDYARKRGGQAAAKGSYVMSAIAPEDEDCKYIRSEGGRCLSTSQQQWPIVAYLTYALYIGLQSLLLARAEAPTSKTDW
ncbi:hypothetical protein MSG28_005737 [Choristoneura fumiferana]|uniref:Uncharacterized protein n=1 Tax=Choristoneura fumiferana TaxID=7141 RepID=A0ACC0L179_CHOFU|nr:hypothetical protein MSG28_005737 [Choristoneura fumiferana]